jgi:transposase-like protein
MIDPTIKTPLICKYCGSNAVIKYGKYKGDQRYLCKACLRKFKGDTARYHMKVPSASINRVLNMYYEVIPVSRIQEYIKKEDKVLVSKSIIYRWIKKFTDSTAGYFQSFQPIVGGIWIVKERSFELDARRNVWLYDVLDNSTRFLLSSRVVASNRITKIETIIAEAVERSRKIPGEVIYDPDDSFQKKANNPPVSIPGKIIYMKDRFFLKPQNNAINTILITHELGNTPELLSRFEAEVDQKKIPRPFKYLESFVGFVKGWLVYYNYFKQNDIPGGKTPAENARINYKVKNWTEV